MDAYWTRGEKCDFSFSSWRSRKHFSELQISFCKGGDGHMTISPDLSELIAKLIEDYRKGEPASPELRKLVAQEDVLPLFCDMGGVFTINTDGEIRSFLWDDTSHGEVESDLRIRNLVLFQGSKKYPELEVLIKKPDDARVCAHCGGTGIAPFAVSLKADNIVCYCGGLGWIP